MLQKPSKAIWNLRAAIKYGDCQAQEDLAHYVLEELPEIAKIVKEAEVNLKEITGGDASFDAYMSLNVDHERVHKQVKAIFCRLQNQNLTEGKQLSYRVEP